MLTELTNWHHILSAEPMDPLRPVICVNEDGKLYLFANPEFLDLKIIQEAKLVAWAQICQQKIADFFSPKSVTFARNQKSNEHG